MTCKDIIMVIILVFLIIITDMTCNIMPCRYDVIWIQWALLYLTDGKSACSMLLPMAAFLHVTCDDIQFCMDA
jgi:hypothetical protein